MPLVSIVVPMADDVRDGARRVASAQAQAYPRCEVIAVCTSDFSTLPAAIHVPRASLSEAINAGISASTGDLISLLLPGVSYSPNKIVRQIAFMKQFELERAVVFCDHTLLGHAALPAESVRLPSIDPSSVFRELYCGMSVQLSGLLIPRWILEARGPLDGESAPVIAAGLLLDLCRVAPFIGMAEDHVSVTRSTLDRKARREARLVCAKFLPDFLRESRRGGGRSDLFGALGEAAAARWSDADVGAVWDLVLVLRAELWRTNRKRAALSAFLRPALRTVFRSLPAKVRRMLRSSMRTHAGTGQGRLDFSAIYRDNGFVGTESRSGAGSTLFQTRIIRRELPVLLHRLGVKSVLDIPCGDFHWMLDVDLRGIQYLGADVVDAMTSENRRRFTAPGRDFLCADLVSGPLPTADLVFCRDCLVHLPFVDALSAIDTVRNSRSQWLLTTTFTRLAPNRELDGEGWRPLNLTLAPFNLPVPDLMISEKCTEAGGLAGDKVLGLWRIADLRLPHSV